ncbi:unnamed protein product [Phytomonas sp. EM1]|nr:unnamed protein product [Phytomonas sp. EM1]|eukprot:CCW61889.1 unnamed protein product [Phytomonas sp. isolate EM1]
MASNSRPPVKPEKPFIPPLTLESCETGGGWGVGEIFARLPPAQEQAKSQEKLYRVAKSPSQAGNSKSLSLKPAVKGSSTVSVAATKNGVNGVAQSMSGVVHEHPSGARGVDRSLTEVPYVRADSGNGVPVVVYNHQKDDDDNTFIDHGSTANGVYAQKATPNGGNSTKAMWRPSQEKTLSAYPIPSWTNTLKPNPVQSIRVNSNSAAAINNSIAVPGPQLGVEKLPTGANVNSGASASPTAATSSLALSLPAKEATLKAGGLPITSASADCQRVVSSYGSSDVVTTVWRPPRIVSELLLDAPARDLAVSPDGGAVWAAFGDHPPTLFEVCSEKNTLESVRSVNWVTQVYCMAVVPLPTAKWITFKSVTANEGPEPNLNPSSSTKRKDRHSAKNFHLHRGLSSSITDDNLCTYALWCGLSRGNISIVDLHNFSDSGAINGAHDQAVNKIWYLENGRVWTAGRDKALKVWDPQTRRMLKKRNIAAVLSDLCYVPTAHQVWAIADDAYIRVYEAGGNNVRIQKRPIDHAENALKMRSDVTLIEYHQDGNFVWASMSKSTVLIDPRTFAVSQTLLVALTALVFHKKTAIICGRGPLLLDNDADSVAILDVTNPVEPSLLFSGFRVNAPSGLGIRLLTAAQPFAILEYYSTRNDKKTLCMFTYEEFNGRVYRDEENIPPQRKVKGGMPSVPSQNVHPISPVNAAVGINSGVAAANVVNAGAAANKQLVGRASSPASLITANNHILNSNTPHVHPTPSLVRAVVPASGPSTSFNGNLLVASAEVSSALDQMDRKLEEVRKAVAIERREKGPLSDFSKLHNTLTGWVVEVTDYALPSLPPAVVEELSREYETPEGKALAIAFARLQCAVTGRKHPADVAAGVHGSEYFAVMPTPQPATSNSKVISTHPTAPAVLPARMYAYSENGSTPQTPSSEATNGGCGGSFSWSARADLSARAAEAQIQAGGSYAGKNSNSSEQILLQLIKEERQTHQAQVQSLQQHNSRIHARLESLITGVKDFVGRTVGSYQELKSIRMNGLPQDTLMFYDRFIAVLEQTPLLSINSCSSREEIADVLRKQAAASETNIHALRDFVCALCKACTVATPNYGNSFSPLFSLDGSQRMLLPQAQASLWPHDLPHSNAQSHSVDEAFSSSAGILLTKTPQASTSRGSPVFRWAQNETVDRASEIEWYLPSIACSALSQVQLIRLIGEVAANVEESMKQVEGRWNMLKQSRRQVMDDITKRCSGSSKGEERLSHTVDLSEDFMQCTAVWDLSIAEIFIRMCKDEASLIIMEALLEWRRDAHPRCSTCQTGAYENPSQNWVHTILSSGYRKRSIAHPYLSRAEGADNLARLSGGLFCPESQSCGKVERDYVMSGVPNDDNSDVNHKGDWISDDDAFNASRGSESSATWVAASQQVSMLSLRMESVVASIRTSLQQEISCGENVLKSLPEQEAPLSFSVSESGEEPVASPKGAESKGLSADNEREDDCIAFNKDLYLGLAGPELRRLVKTHATRLDGFLHWAWVGVYLTALCLNSICALIYPTASSLSGKDSSSSSSSPPLSRIIDTGNFLVINKKLIDCAYFLSNVMTYSYVTRCVLLGWQASPKSTMLSANNPVHHDSCQFGISNAHQGPLTNVSCASTGGRSFPNETLQSPTGESVLLNSMNFDSTLSNSKPSKDHHSNLKCTFGHCHSNSTSIAASDDVTVSRVWVRRDLRKRQWISLFSFYTRLVLQQQIPPELFLPSGNEEDVDDDIHVKRVYTENNGVTDSVSRRSGRSKQAAQSQHGEDNSQQSGKSRHARRNDSELQQVTFYLGKYAEKVSALFEIASNALENCHQLEKRMHTIGRENSGDSMSDAGSNKERGKNTNEGCAAKISNTVTVSYVSEAESLHAIDPKTILCHM